MHYNIMEYNSNEFKDCVILWVDTNISGTFASIFWLQDKMLRSFKYMQTFQAIRSLAGYTFFRYRY